jgi:DNA-binding NtrC family response regulator
MAAPQASSAPVVVVVDDEPAVLAMMERALRTAGFQVHTAADGLQAIRVIGDLPAPPAMMVSDLRMEPVDGASLARVVEAEWPASRILLVSGWGAEATTGSLAWPLLKKPFTPDQLLELVERMLSPSSGQAQAS